MRNRDNVYIGLYSFEPHTAERLIVRCMPIAERYKQGQPIIIVGRKVPAHVLHRPLCELLERGDIVESMSVSVYEGEEIADSHVDSDGCLPPLTALFTGVTVLSALESIAIYSPLLSKVDGDILEDALKSLPQLRSLELANFTLDSFQELRRVIGACVGLNSIYLNGLNQNAMITGWNIPQPPCPLLKMFSAMDCQFVGAMFKWMEESYSQGVGTIFIGANNSYRRQAEFGKFLRQNGPALQKLCIEQNPIPLAERNPYTIEVPNSEPYTPFEP